MRLLVTGVMSHVNAEIMAEAGFDLMIIDMEHSQLSLQDTVHIIQTTKERAAPRLSGRRGTIWFGLSRLWIQALTAFSTLCFHKKKRLNTP